MIAAGEMSELLRMVAAKQQLIVALQAIEKQLAPFQSQTPEARAWSSAALRERCAADAEACRQKLRKAASRAAQQGHYAEKHHAQEWQGEQRGFDFQLEHAGTYQGQIRKQ